MCTIGNSFYNLNGINVQSVFKQCDLVDATTFLTPVVKTASAEDGTTIRYVEFTRKKGEDSPAWAGVNEYGVCFVAADSYLDSNTKTAQNKTAQKTVQDKITQSTAGSITASVFDMYHNIVAGYTTAKAAVDMAKKFYETERYSDDMTDILMISDEKEMYFIETVNAEVRIVKRTDGHFASANHCRMFYEAVPYEKNHSTYLRLKRAEELLQFRSDDTGIGNLLRDSYYGKTVWSICRYASVTDYDGEQVKGNDEDMYYTQASVIFSIKHNSASEKKPEVVCEYVINGNASGAYSGYVWKPFDESASNPVNVPLIGVNDNIICMV